MLLSEYMSVGDIIERLNEMMKADDGHSRKMAISQAVEELAWFETLSESETSTV